MRAEYELASRALERLIEECDRASPAELPARHSDLAEFFASSELVDSAYRAARACAPGHPSMSVGRMLVPLIWKEHRQRLQALALEVHEMQAENSDSEDLAIILGSYSNGRPCGTLGEFLRAMCTAAPPMPETMNDLRGLLGAVSEFERGLRNRLHDRRVTMRGVAADIIRTLSQDIARGVDAERFLGALGTFGADCYLDGLRALHAYLTDLKNRRQLPAASDPRFLFDQLSEQQALGMRAEVRRLAVLVNEQLLSSRSALHAMARLKLRMERFGRDRLLSAIARQRGSNEKLVQAVIDEHFFTDGFFPISHVDLSEGRSDTLAELAYGLRGEVDQSGQPPILLEIKQCIERKETSRQAAVKHAFENAWAQVEQYSAACRANPPWRGVEPWVVIVYDGCERYSLRCAPERVQLCYLGGAPPSDAIAIDLPS